MFKFLKEMLSESGSISSKRVMMAFFALIFAYAFISNHHTGLPVDETMKWQMFGILIWLISVVFGEKLPDIFTAWFGKRAGLPEQKEKNEKGKSN